MQKQLFYFGRKDAFILCILIILLLLTRTAFAKMEQDPQITREIIDVQNNVLQERELIKEYYQKDIRGGYSLIKEYHVKWIDQNTGKVLQDFTDEVVTQISTDLTNKHLGLASSVKVYPRTPEMDKKMAEKADKYTASLRFIEKNLWLYKLLTKVDIELAAILLAALTLFIVLKRRMFYFIKQKFFTKKTVAGLMIATLTGLSWQIAHADAWPPTGWKATDYIWGYNPARQRTTNQNMLLPYTLATLKATYTDGSKVGPSRATPIIIGDELYAVDTAHGKLSAFDLIERKFDWTISVGSASAVNADYYYAGNILVLPISTSVSASSTNSVALINASNGSIIKTFSLASGYWTASEPLIIDNYAFVQTRTGYVYRINLSSRTLDVSVKAATSSEMFVGSPVRIWSGSNVFFVATDCGAGSSGGNGSLYRYDTSLTRQAYGSDVIVNGVQGTGLSDGNYMYYLNEAGGLHKFSSAASQVGYATPPASGWRALNSPVWADGYIFYHVEDANGNSHSYKVATSNMAKVTWTPNSDGGYPITGSMSGSNSTQGRLIWWPYTNAAGVGYMRAVKAADAAAADAFRWPDGALHSYYQFETDDFSSIVVGGGSKLVLAAIGSTGLGIWEPAYPDLRVLSITTPSNPNTTTAYSYSAVIQNNGAWASGACNAALQVDGVQVAKVSLAALSKSAQTTVTFSNIKISTPGTHTITVVADCDDQVTEQLENNNTLSKSIAVADVAAPTITLNPTSRGWANSDVSVAVSVSDVGGAGINTVQYAWTNSTTKPTSGWISTSASATLTQSGNGTWYLHVQATDKAGNYAYTYGGPYRIDKTAPTTSSGYVSGAVYVNGSTYWIKNGSTITFWMQTYDSLSGANRTYIKVVRTADSAAWEICKQTGNDGWTNSSFTGMTITGTQVTDSGTTYKANFDIAIQSATEYDFNVYRQGADNAGNFSGFIDTGYDIKVDSTAPTVSASLATRSWDNTDASVTLTYSDARSGIATHQYAWSTTTTTPTSWTNYTGAVTQTSTGIWYLHYKAVDNVGNIKTGYFGPYYIDKLAPTVIASPATRDWDNTDVTVTLTYSDSGGSGLSLKQYAWSTVTTTPTSWTDYTAAVSQSISGIWYLHYKVTDVAGNVVTGYFGPYNVDKIPPAVTAYPPMRAWGNTDMTVTLVYNDNGGSGLSIQQYAWSNSTITPTTWTDYTAAVTQSATGIWYLHYRAVDTAGNTATGYFGPYKIDKILPSVTFNPYSVDLATSPVNVTITPVDNGGSGIKQWRYKLSNDGGVSYGEWVETLTSSTPKTITLNGDGDWRIQVEITDNAGNINEVTSGIYHIITSQLKNLRITDIVNPPTNYTYPIYQDDMPANVKAGYRVTFEIDAEGVFDRIEIIDNFGETSYMSKKSGDNTHSIWSMDYIVPLDTPVGTIINFNITGYGVDTYNYNQERNFNGNVLLIVGNALEDVYIYRIY